MLVLIIPEQSKKGSNCDLGELKFTEGDIGAEYWKIDIISKVEKTF